MSQSVDYVLSDQTGASFRAELNSILAAIASNNASTIAPSATVGYMFYANMSTTAMQVRNAADTLFLNVFKMTVSSVTPYIVGSTGAAELGSAIVQRTKANTFQKAQRGAIVSVTYASTVVVDMNLGNNFEVSPMTGNLIVGNPSAIVNAVGQGGSMFFNTGAAASRTISFGTMFKFPAGTAPTGSTTSSTRDRCDFKVRNVSTIDSVFSNNVS